MNEPSVTIVVPCYNQGRFLPASIASVRAQTVDPASIELIVVDDGSRDDTAAIANDLGVTVIRQPNLGLSAARNAGLAAARGVFIVFLDADDELLPDAVATGAAAFNDHPALACVLRHCVLIDEQGRPTPTQPPEIEYGDIYTELLHRNPTWAPGAAMFRRNAVLAAGGFPLTIEAAGDYSLYLHFARTGRLAYFDRAAVRYRKHEQNMSHNPIVMLEATLMVLDRERPLVPARLQPEWVAGRRGWCRFYGDQIVDGMRSEWRDRRRTRELWRALSALVRLCPSVALMHAFRKGSRIARGLPATELDAPAPLGTPSGRPRDTGR